MTHQPENEVLPPAVQRVRPVKLNTVGAILAEMQRLYRGARSGTLPVEDLTRFIFALEKIRGTVEAAQVIDHIPGKPGSYVTEVDVVSIPYDWAVIGLLGNQIHVPNAILPKLRELLPPDCFTPIPDPSIPDPIDDALPGSMKPMLRVLDGSDPEGPQAA